MPVASSNSVTLPIRGWHYKLQLAEHEFAKGSSDQEIDIPAHGETQIDVDIDAELTKLLRLLNADRRSPLIYRLNGDVGVAAQALQMPFKAEGKIKLNF